MYDANDIVEQKNRDKRRRRLAKLLLVLALAVLGAALYFTQEMWLPKLRGLGTQYKTIVNDGRLAEGNFPLEINGGAQYQLSCSNDNIIVMSDAYIYFYNEEGGEIKRRQHALSNAVMEAVNGRALIFESGGMEFSVEDKSGVLYTDRLDKNIMFARLSKEGYTAVVTTSDNYDCEIFVYDRKGKEQSVEADKVLMAVGRRPVVEGYGLENTSIEHDARGIVVDDNMQTNVPGVYAIGDVNARMMLAHAATMQGLHVVNHILGIADNIRLDIMPAAIFTNPEAACVGKTEDQLKAEGV